MAAQQDLSQSDPIQSPEAVPDRRAHPRHSVDCAVRISLLLGEGEAFGRISNLSLGGCLIVCQTRVLALQSRVEVAFQLRGIVFRLAGITVSTRNPHAFAIRFMDIPARRRQELGAVLDEEAACNAARAAAEAENPAPASAPSTADPALRLVPAAPSLPAAKDQLLETCAAIVRAASPAIPARERRTTTRHAVDTRANLLLVKTGITMAGRILNLSLGGCQIRMEERFNVGIYVRVEAEFFLHGLPFRVGGVSQAIVDKFTIGVRFLDLSDRRRDQLTELMTEIAEANSEGVAAPAAAPSTE